MRPPVGVQPGNSAPSPAKVRFSALRRHSTRGSGSSAHPPDRRGKIARRPNSQYAPRAQLLHLAFTHAEPAEDFGVVLAELGCDGAHAHAIADLDRGADVRHFAEL